MNSPARMRDVAELAGVATMTVSRVINGNTHVSEETRQRVFDAIKTLNYRPNTLARSLREQRSRQIGVIVPNIHDPFFAVCAQAVSVVAKKYAYSVNIAMSDEEPEAEYNEAILMLQRNVEGLVVIPAAGPSRLTGGEFSKIPLVTLDRPIPGTHFDSVIVKNAEGSERVVDHLIQHGHRRIAFIGLPLELYTMQERHSGYRRAMKKARLKHEVYCKSWTAAEMLRMLKSVTGGADPVTAIFCGNNLTTRNVLHGLSKLGLRVPKQVALVGFDDFETADLLSPAVTVVSQPMVEMGRCGAQLLFTRILRQEQSRNNEQVVLPVELIIRNSCGEHRA